MANMVLIEAKTSTSSSVTFSAIPQTYTDLKLVISARSGYSSTDDLDIRPNGSTSNLTAKRIYANGTSALSDSGTNGLINGTNTTSDTFANVEIYFPNYTSSNYKSFSLEGAMENNDTFAYTYFTSYLWSDNTAISSLTIGAGSNSFVSGSTFYLYGISNVTSGSKATGGIVSSDGTYWYHLFPNTATFTPTESITADILVVGGGGGGGSNIGGGGGAGGLRYFASQSLTATGYTCTVGAGGVGPIVVPDYYGGAGGSSQFGALTSAAGGGYGTGTASGNASGSGASSGGNRATNPIGSASLGNIGAGHTSINGAGGGGGFSGAGVQGTSTTGGTGGIGTATYQAFAYATGTGDKGYYAGGGGGSGFPYGSGGPFGFGGLGGGGDGMVSGDDLPRPGKQSTGGGGGGGFSNGTTNPVQYNNGGSGVIIVRYLI